MTLNINSEFFVAGSPESQYTIIADILISEKVLMIYNTENIFAVLYIWSTFFYQGSLQPCLNTLQIHPRNVDLCLLKN